MVQNCLNFKISTVNSFSWEAKQMVRALREFRLRRIKKMLKLKLQGIRKANSIKEKRLLFQVIGISDLN